MTHGVYNYYTLMTETTKDKLTQKHLSKDLLISASWKIKFT